VARRLALILALTSLLGLAVAPGAIAAGGIDGGRAIAQLERPATSSSLIAPVDVCPGQGDRGAEIEAQEQAMRCMTDYARQQLGLNGLGDVEALDTSARSKTLDILHCDSFSHFACGREFTYWMKETGYIGASCWHVGENLAWGTGAQGSVRSIFRAWMRSPGHRRNILGSYDDLGLSLEVGALGGRSGTSVWAQHFGSHCEE
jgi:uncharacterized protein YkwD